YHGSSGQGGTRPPLRRSHTTGAGGPERGGTRKLSPHTRRGRRRLPPCDGPRQMRILGTSSRTAQPNPVGQVLLTQPVLDDRPLALLRASASGASGDGDAAAGGGGGHGVHLSHLLGTSRFTSQ